MEIIFYFLCFYNKYVDIYRRKTIIFLPSCPFFIIKIVRVSSKHYEYFFDSFALFFSCKGQWIMRNTPE